MKVPAIRRRNSQNRAEVRRRAALEEGKAISYYAKEIAKKLMHPTKEASGAVARKKDANRFGSNAGLHVEAHPVSTDFSAYHEGE